MYKSNNIQINTTGGFIGGKKQNPRANFVMKLERYQNRNGTGHLPAAKALLRKLIKEDPQHLIDNIERYDKQLEEDEQDEIRRHREDQRGLEQDEIRRHREGQGLKKRKYEHKPKVVIPREDYLKLAEKIVRWYRKQPDNDLRSWVEKKLEEYIKKDSVKGRNNLLEINNILWPYR